MRKRSTILFALVVMLLLTVPSSAIAEKHTSVRIEPESEQHYRIGNVSDDEVGSITVKITLVQGPGVTVYITNGQLTPSGNNTYAGDKVETEEIVTSGRETEVFFEFKDINAGEYYLYVVNYESDNASTVDLEFKLEKIEEWKLFMLCCVLPIGIPAVIIGLVVWFFVRRRRKRMRELMAGAPPGGYPPQYPQQPYQEPEKPYQQTPEKPFAPMMNPPIEPPSRPQAPVESPQEQGESNGSKDEK